MKECLDSINKNFDALNEYFHSIDAPKIQAFFDDPFALATLVFVRDQSANFQKTILQLEGDCICAVDAANTIDQLKLNIEIRLQNNYMSLELRDALAVIGENFAQRKRKFIEITQTFLRKTLSYLTDWTKWLNDIKVFSWVCLKEKLKWDHVECAALWMVGRNYFNSNDMDALFDQFAILDHYLNSNKESLNEVQLSHKKWAQVFRHFTEKSLPFDELLKVVEFALVIPATNATAERVFSHINDMWTPEKGQMLIENVYARLLVKFNWSESCLDFYNKIKILNS